MAFCYNASVLHVTVEAFHQPITSFRQQGQFVSVLCWTTEQRCQARLLSRGSISTDHRPHPTTTTCRPDCTTYPIWHWLSIKCIMQLITMHVPSMIAMCLEGKYTHLTRTLLHQETTCMNILVYMHVSCDMTISWCRGDAFHCNRDHEIKATASFRTPHMPHVFDHCATQSAIITTVQRQLINMILDKCCESRSHKPTKR